MYYEHEMQRIGVGCQDSVPCVVEGALFSIYAFPECCSYHCLHGLSALCWINVSLKSDNFEEVFVTVLGLLIEAAKLCRKLSLAELREFR